MMHIPLSDVRTMSWWEYQAVLWNHNDRHTSEEDKPIDAPDPEAVARSQQRLADRGLARTIH